MPELLELAERIAGEADTAKGEAIEAYLSSGREALVRVFDGEIERLSSAESAGVGVRVVRDHRVGFAWVGALDESSARGALVQARENASYTTIDEHAGLARPDGVEPASLSLWRDELVECPMESKVELAIDVERRSRDLDHRIRRVVHADYSDRIGEWAVAASTGVSACSRRTSCVLSVYVIAGEGADTATGFGCSAGRELSELDASHCAGEAVERATRLLAATKPRSAHLSVVLDRRVTAALLAVLARTLSGDEVAKGRSLFAHRVGEAIAAGHVTLVEDPSDPASWGATPSDAEGLATRRNELIAGGKLMGYLYDTHAASLAATASTGSAVRGGYRTPPSVGARAVTLVAGELSEEEILTEVGEGLFVQSITGVHSGVNPVSGDFSVGAEGLMIRGGAFAEPVREMTIASTLQRVLQHIRHVGSDLEWLPGVSAGMTVAIDDVSLGGL